MAANIRDWRSAFGFDLPRNVLAALGVPALVVWGGSRHPAAQQANAALCSAMTGARSAIIPAAAHFMIATHPQNVAAVVADHVHQAQSGLIAW